MTTQDFINDIPRELAYRAHAGTSHVPDDRADMERTEYASTLSADFEMLAAHATTDDKRALLQSGFVRYREGYKTRCLAYLESRSRCLSAMITGPSNFPTRRNQKRNGTADRRLQELIEYRRRGLDAIRKALHPESRPIMAGDTDAISRLGQKVAEAEKMQITMREVNAAIRRQAKEGAEAQVKAVMAVDPAITEADAREWLLPDELGRIGFPAYKLTNNNANIHRMKSRIDLLSRDKATADLTKRGDNGVLMTDCPADSRVRLFFPMIPPEPVRARLKSSGFRWHPWLRCWQAFRNPQTLERARDFITATPEARVA
jgi:hypothetical protein